MATSWETKKINEMCRRVDVALSTCQAPSIMRDIINDRFYQFQLEGYSETVAFAKALRCFPATAHIN